MPTDQSPVLQLSPVSALEDGPPHSPVKVRDAPDSRLVMQGRQEIRHPNESCKSCKDRGLERLLMVLGSLTAEGSRLRQRRKDHRQTWIRCCNTNPTPAPNLAETERGPRVWVTGSVVKIGKISALEKVLEEQDEK